MTIIQRFDEGKFKHLEGELLDVTQMAAVSAARAAGHGDKNAADEAAVNAMRKSLGDIRGIKTVVKIGEGERDEAPMLFIGEEIGNGSFQIDLAVDPLENTNATAKLGPNAICVLAASNPRRSSFCKRWLHGQTSCWSKSGGKNQYQEFGRGKHFNNCSNPEQRY